MQCTPTFLYVSIYYKSKEYDLDIMRQIASFFLNPIIVDSYAFLFTWKTVGRVSDSVKALT